MIEILLLATSRGPNAIVSAYPAHTVLILGGLK